MQDRAFLLIALLLGLAAFAAAPALVALVRQHPDRRLIYKLSPLTLLSFILWFGLIAWAATGRRDDAVISRYVAKLRANNLLPLAITALLLVGVAGSVIAMLI